MSGQAIAYPYSNPDLLERPEMYRYTEVGGEHLIKAYNESRRTCMVNIQSKVENQSATSAWPEIEQLWRNDGGVHDPLLQAIRRFETARRIRPKGIGKTGSPILGEAPATWAEFTIKVAERARSSRDLRDLNCLLKVLDHVLPLLESQTVDPEALMRIQESINIEMEIINCRLNGLRAARE